MEPSRAVLRDEQVPEHTREQEDTGQRSSADGTGLDGSRDNGRGEAEPQRRPDRPPPALESVAVEPGQSGPEYGPDRGGAPEHRRDGESRQRDARHERESSADRESERPPAEHRYSPPRRPSRETRRLCVGAPRCCLVVSTGLAAGASRVGGRPVSVLLAYPFAMTALFLPPVVAALVTPSLEQLILPPSYDLAAWILDTFLFVGGLNDVIRGAFDLETFGQQWGLPGLGYLLMWVGISVPLGWFLGALVALANLVRPRPDA